MVHHGTVGVLRLQEVLLVVAVVLLVEIPLVLLRLHPVPLGKEILEVMELQLTWELMLLEVEVEELVPQEQQVQVQLEVMAE